MLEEKDSQHLVDALNPSSGFAVDSNVPLEPVNGPKGRLDTRRPGPFQEIGNKGNSYILLNLNSLPTYHKWYSFSLTLIESTPDQSLHSQTYRCKQTKSLLLKVRWLGYDTSHVTWEPWENLNSVDKLHSYLKEIDWLNEIPRRFR